MFLIFINDLLCYVTSRVHLFAVDTVIYLTIKSDSDCRQLQDDLHSLEKWESDWCVEFNPSKCNVIRVTRRSKPFKLQYKRYGKVLETVDTTKCLGINLSNDLCWNDHVNEITTKANKTLNLLRSNLRACLSKSKERAYKSLERPIVAYSATVWDPYVAKNIQQVKMIQRCAARWLLGRYDRLDSVTNMFFSLKWRSLELGRSDARLCMLYKQSNELATYECDKLQREHKRRIDTRLSSLSHRFEQPRYTLYMRGDYYKNSFYPRTFAQWNNLPPEIIASTSPCSFRQSLCNLQY